MGISTKPITWLDLAAGRRWGRDCSQLELHPVSAGCGNCFVLSMTGRMLCSGDGRLTVFRSREAVEHFLMLLHLDTPPVGKPISNLHAIGRRQHCLRLAGTTLCGCGADAEMAVPRADRRRPGRYTASESRQRASREAIV